MCTSFKVKEKQDLIWLWGGMGVSILLPCVSVAQLVEAHGKMMARYWILKYLTGIQTQEHLNIS